MSLQIKWKKRSRWEQCTNYEGFRYSLCYNYGSGIYFLQSHELDNWDNDSEVDLGQLDTLTEAKAEAVEIIQKGTIANKSQSN